MSRFSKLANKLAHKKGVTNPKAVAAVIGRRKYGAKKFSQMAAAGKRHEALVIEKISEAVDQIVRKKRLDKIVVGTIRDAQNRGPSRKATQTSMGKFTKLRKILNRHRSKGC